MTDQIQTSAEMLEAEAIPRCREVHTESDDHGPDLPEPLKKPVGNKSPARWAYERLILYVKKFEESLDGDQEVALGFTGGDAGTLRIEGMGYFDPDIVTFYGTDTMGLKTQMIQHVSQLNVLLRAAPKHVDRPEPIRIGFRLAEEIEVEQVLENDDIPVT
ncbi:DUF6173 family protein [Aestuariibius sp. 2305UL40-4]|uniref:DUF6173 family protein n=1 Tax=Aestuariibius violaceus TaxID=3234132 RepID=UPI00345E8423